MPGGIYHGDSTYRKQAGAHAETTVTLVNRQEGTVKIAVYNENDALQAIPLAAWNVNPTKSVDWDRAPARFHVKVFQPQLVAGVGEPSELSRAGSGRAAVSGRAAAGHHQARRGHRRLDGQLDAL